jgi:hypothetical protein
MENQQERQIHYKNALSTIKSQFPMLDVQNHHYMAGMDTMNKDLDDLATIIDNFTRILKSYAEEINYDSLRKYIIDQRGENVSIQREDSDGPEQLYYKIALSNIPLLEERIEQLKSMDEQVKTMQQSQIALHLTLASRILNDAIVHSDFKHLNIVDFLAHDINELLEIYEQVLEEIKTFRAVCRLIQSFTQEEVERVLSQTE